eukprot:TRINITY_DN1466_c0_g1_i12.p1 TRINITY_DN1466_c0_g1~~TRINITY_DN1466_c0_g1_i12.p1  ORF type:complete len:1222 (-),score=469.78 TRINITY_DN1466_c0_g1_i12:54-3719(-)
MSSADVLFAETDEETVELQKRQREESDDDADLESDDENDEDRAPVVGCDGETKFPPIPLKDAPVPVGTYKAKSLFVETEDKGTEFEYEKPDPVAEGAAAIPPPPPPSAFAGEQYKLDEDDPLADPRFVNNKWDNVHDATNAIARTFRFFKNRKKFRKAVKKVIQRNRVANEIMTSERSYVNSLKTSIKIIKEPMMLRLEELGVTMSDVELMFSNMEDLIALNSALLARFEERLEEWTPSAPMSDIFLDVMEDLQVYAPYYSNYNLASDKVAELRENSPAFVEFLLECKNNPEANGLDLSSFLIMPVQRIPRYNLLLRDFIKPTIESHPDMENLMLAADQMDQVGRTMNESIAGSQDRIKMISIQDSLVGEFEPIVDAYRTFLAEAHCVTADEGRPISLFLFNDILIFAYPLKRDKYQFHERVELMSSRLIDMPATLFQNMLKIEWPVKQEVTIIMEDSDDKAHLMATMQNAIEELSSKALEAMLGGDDEDDSEAEVLTSTDELTDPIKILNSGNVAVHAKMLKHMLKLSENKENNGRIILESGALEVLCDHLNDHHPLNQELATACIANLSDCFTLTEEDYAQCFVTNSNYQIALFNKLQGKSLTQCQSAAHTLTNLFSIYGQYLGGPFTDESHNVIALGGLLGHHENVKLVIQVLKCMRALLENNVAEASEHLNANTESLKQLVEFIDIRDKTLVSADAKKDAEEEAASSSSSSSSSSEGENQEGTASEEQEATEGGEAAEEGEEDEGIKELDPRIVENALLVMEALMESKILRPTLLDLGVIEPLIYMLSQEEYRNVALSTIKSMALHSKSRNALVDFNGIEAVTDMLQVQASAEAGDLDLMESALSLLRNLLVKDENKIVFKNAGGMQLLLQLLDHSDETVRLNALSLTTVGVSAEELRQPFVENKGIDQVAGRLSKEPKNIQEQSIKLFEALLRSEDKEVAQTLLDANILGILLKNLEGASIQLQQTIMKSLLALSRLNKYVGNQLVNSNGIPVLNSVFKGRSGILQEQAATLIKQFAHISVFMDAFLVTEGIQLMIDLLANSKTGGVLDKIAAALGACSAQKRTRELLRELDIFAYLLPLFASENDAVVCSAAFCFGNVATKEQPVKVIKKSGIVSQLLELAERGSDAVKAECVRALASISDADDNKMKSLIKDCGAVNILVSLLTNSNDLVQLQATHTLCLLCDNDKILKSVTKTDAKDILLQYSLQAPVPQTQE